MSGTCKFGIHFAMAFPSLLLILAVLAPTYAFPQMPSLVSDGIQPATGTGGTNHPPLPTGSSKMEGFLVTIGTPATLTQPVGVASWDTQATPTLTTVVSISGQPQTITLGPSNTPIPLITVTENNGGIYACVETTYSVMGPRTGCILGWSQTISTPASGSFTPFGTGPFGSSLPFQTGGTQAISTGGSPSGTSGAGTGGVSPLSTNIGGASSPSVSGIFGPSTGLPPTGGVSGTGTNGGGVQTGTSNPVPSGSPSDAVTSVPTGIGFTGPGTGLSPSNTLQPSGSGITGPGTGLSPSNILQPSGTNSGSNPTGTPIPTGSQQSNPTIQPSGPSQLSGSAPSGGALPSGSQGTSGGSPPTSAIIPPSGTQGTTGGAIPTTGAPAPSSGAPTQGPGNTGTSLGGATTQAPAAMTSSPNIFANPSQSNTVITQSGVTGTYSLQTFSEFATLTGTTTITTDYPVTKSDGSTSETHFPVIVGPGGVHWEPTCNGILCPAGGGGGGGRMCVILIFYMPLFLPSSGFLRHGS